MFRTKKRPNFEILKFLTWFFFSYRIDKYFNKWMSCITSALISRVFELKKRPKYLGLKQIQVFNLITKFIIIIIIFILLILILNTLHLRIMLWVSWLVINFFIWLCLCVFSNKFYRMIKTKTLCSSAKSDQTKN